MQHVIGKISFPEKVQDVLDKSSFNKYGFVSKEFIEGNLVNLSVITNIKKIEMPVIDSRKRVNKFMKGKSSDKKVMSKKRKFIIEEEVGKIIDTEG
ncbi:hypothetical protein FHQ18_11060 [Deferribacter autotrophicus]|uniref:Uncharacterized protein n=1 Tax=Deferribacter autotrophicus TaxID=500465 RepID=A0A5A8EZJ5_9BACT|nr:hypothetical protein [Deferribacter autotrophicus]KAA0257100.1 hypothetical protein FHQ18_11060 [Deferribacter autotrophicus]